MTERLLFNEQEIDLRIKSIVHQILADGLENVAFVGIRTRGVPMAHWMASHYKKLTGQDPKFGILDINLYRDDLTEVAKDAIIQKNKTEISFDLNNANVLLVDDVLYTGRTIRCAMDALIDIGRPKRILLAVLVDRGWREMPIDANYAGIRLHTKADEVVKVMFKETDGVNQVVIKENFNKRT